MKLTARFACLTLVCVTYTLFGFTPVWSVDQSAAAVKTAPADIITKHQYSSEANRAAAPYLLYHPSADVPTEKRSLLIFLYGAGGSTKNYNFMRPPYAKLRQQLADRGYFVVVPGLGRLHFMNDQAKSTLDGLVAELLKQHEIPAGRVHVMGTSMGGGSSLAYAIHRQDMIQSVCAVMPMTDFGLWVVEKPHYLIPVANAFGGKQEEVPNAYAKNSAVSNVDAFKNIPVMLVHGTGDRIVRYSQSEKLAKLLQENGSVCKLHTVKDMTHKDDVMQDIQMQAADFFDAAVE